MVGYSNHLVLAPRNDLCIPNATPVCACQAASGSKAAGAAEAPAKVAAAAPKKKKAVDPAMALLAEGLTAKKK